MIQNKGKPNPDNNPIIQMLLDCEACGVTFPGIRQVFDEDEEKLKEVTQLFESHQYPNKKIQYAQTTNLKVHKAKLSLLRNNQTAAVIFDLMAESCGINNYTQIGKISISELLNISESTTKRAINYLKENGYIRIVIKATSHTPPVYQVNPTLVWVGKPNHKQAAIHEYNKAIGKDIRQRFETLDNQFANKEVTYITIPINETGQVIKATEIRTVKLKKEPSELPPSEDPENINDNNISF